MAPVIGSDIHIKLPCCERFNRFNYLSAAVLCVVVNYCCTCQFTRDVGRLSPVALRITAFSFLPCLYELIINENKTGI